MPKSIYSKEHKNLIAKLRQARSELGLSQRKISRLLSKTQSYISKVESGQRRVDIIQLKEFSRIYKKPLDYFLN